MLDKLELLSGEKILMKEVSERSGCERNALSRINQHPDIIPSGATIDKLIQFFFLSFKEVYESQNGSTWMKGWRERRLMESVVKDFISIYPDRQDYWDILPHEFKEVPAAVSLDTVWSIYERLNSAHPRERFKDPTVGDAVHQLAEKLTAAKGFATPSGVRLDLSEEEFNLLFNEFPSFVESIGKTESDPKIRKTGKKKSR